MYTRDWLDDLRWGAVLVGIAVAVVAQVALSLLVMRPLGIGTSWAALILVELCVVAGGFVAAWRAHRAGLVNGLAAALACAAVSLATAAAQAPQQITPLNILFLFATFATMGLAGGLIADRLQAHRAARR